MLMTYTTTCRRRLWIVTTIPLAEISGDYGQLNSSSHVWHRHIIAQVTVYLRCIISSFLAISLQVSCIFLSRTSFLELHQPHHGPAPKLKGAATV